jgi:Ca2+-binding EF-hand superfamily protein
MKGRTLIAVAVAGAFAVPLAAQASDVSSLGDKVILAQAGATPQATTPPPGGTADVREGAIPRAEPAPGADAAAAGDTAAMFDRLDTNRDGYISLEEARAHPEVADQFSRLDRDGDGRLSRSELEGMTAPLATTPPPGGVADVREGAIEERQRLGVTPGAGAAIGGAAAGGMAATTPPEATTPPPGGTADVREGALKPQETPGVAAAGDTAAMFDRLDTNQDGYISLEEARAHPEVADQFSRLDRDGDGRLSRSEFEGWAATAGTVGEPAAGGTALPGTPATGAVAPDAGATTPPPGGVTDVREGATPRAQ